MQSSFVCLCRKSSTFPTDITLNDKGEILITEKGRNRISIFSPDGKTLLRTIPVDESPTGILLDADKAYVTTNAATGHLQIISLETGKQETAIATGSGACYPIFGPDKNTYMYAINSRIRFQRSIRQSTKLSVP